MVVIGKRLRGPCPVCDLEHAPKPVGSRLVGAEHAEIPLRRAGLEYVAQEAAHDRGRLGVALARLADFNRVIGDIGQMQVERAGAAIGVWIGAHAPLARGRQRGDFRTQCTVLIEKLLGPVALHPVFEQPYVVRLGRKLGKRHLVRAPEALGLEAVHLLRPGPALRRLEDDHRPDRAVMLAPVARGLLDGPDFAHHLVERRGHELVHRFGIVSLDEVRLVAVALEQALQFLRADAGEDGRVGDLVAVQVQDWQHRAVRYGAEEFVRVPGRRHRPGLGLAVAHDAGGDQIRIVEHRAISVRKRVAKLAALVDRAGRLGRRVARNAAGEAELLEQPLHAECVARNVGVDFAVGSFEPGIGQNAGGAMAGPGDVDHAQAVRLDDAVEVNVEQVQAGRRAPVAEQPRLDVPEFQRLFQKRVVEEVDLANG